MSEGAFPSALRAMRHIRPGEQGHYGYTVFIPSESCRIKYAFELHRRRR